MGNLKTLYVVVLAVLAVGFGIMMAIYFLQGGNGESEDIPGSPQVVRTALS